MPERERGREGAGGAWREEEGQVPCTEAFQDKAR